jgi:DNA-binding transcriptional ArsR family regulator
MRAPPDCFDADRNEGALRFISTMVEATQPGLTEVLQALSDPVRRAIVRGLAQDGPQACGVFTRLGVSNSTLSHHFRVLRAAGVIETREEGRLRISSLRRDELERRFPGLLALLESER